MRLKRRVVHLEAVSGPALRLSPEAVRYAAHLATATELSVDEVLTEAQSILARAAAQDGTSVRATAACVARAEGRSPNEVLSEAERMVAAWRASGD